MKNHKLLRFSFINFINLEENPILLYILLKKIWLKEIMAKLFLIIKGISYEVFEEIFNNLLIHAYPY
ncbi:MAG: hypothetical protein N3A01_01500 [Bacteroidales bacterium]|nr:hypothetical protein [Bacteroidales bacterium]